MDNKFKNQYRIQTSRLQNWDYSMPGLYYVTICTYSRINYFGNITNNKTILSEIGKIADKYWCQISNHYPNVGLDEYIIMPNHIHGIIAINDKNNIGNKIGNDVLTAGIETPQWGVSTKQPDTPAKQQIPGGYNYKWKPNSLGSIINQYKSICTKRIRRFYDASFR